MTTMYRTMIAIALFFCCAGADDCNSDTDLTDKASDELVERAPPGERGVSSKGVAYENPTPTSGTTDTRVDSVTVGTGGISVTVKPGQ